MRTSHASSSRRDRLPRPARPALRSCAAQLGPSRTNESHPARAVPRCGTLGSFACGAYRPTCGGERRLCRKRWTQLRRARASRRTRRTASRPMPPAAAAAQRLRQHKRPVCQETPHWTIDRWPPRHRCRPQRDGSACDARATRLPCRARVRRMDRCESTERSAHSTAWPPEPVVRIATDLPTQC